MKRLVILLVTLVVPISLYAQGAPNITSAEPFKLGTFDVDGEPRIGIVLQDKVVIELTQGYLLVCTISVGCALGVLASKQASLGTVAYEAAVFANRVSAALTPRLIEELKLTVGS